ncbi:oligopeptide ABC transporter permease [Longirhabdus pacifica]|uniref:oligopeptide ABC transporter permease n=1 Tax=Longirhabdus pacifica TaxID=2305227 RepID=UPI0010092231|nr:oligopeptide ABC transporter permease [Longirhabdus pacifica]
MLKYIIRRLLIMIPMLLLVSIVVFTLAQLMPGDPFGGEIDPTKLKPEQIEEKREQLGYNDPILVQYGRWLSNFVQGDFGKSISYKTDVSVLIKQRLDNTIFLTILALIITYAISFIMGLYSGKKPYTIGDYAINGFNYLALAIPSYVLAIAFIYIFAFNLQWFPSSGSVGMGVEEGTWEYWMSRLNHTLLPAIVLGAFSAASYTQFLRNDIIDNSRKDYVRTARAKGTSESNIYNKHILRNSLIPIVTLFGFDLAFMINGAVITETIFTYPGIGKLFLDSVGKQDYPLIMTLTMMFAVIVIIGNMLADILYSLVDPRVKVE